MDELTNTCKHCRHWLRDISDKVYMGSRERAGWGYCRLTEWTFAEEGSETKAIALDVDQSYGILHTAPDFGCNQFQEVGWTN